MRRITYDGSYLVTSAEVAGAVMDYATEVVRLGASASVQLPVLEANGSIVTHSILIGPATQLELVDIDGAAGAVSEDAFVMPVFPPLMTRGAPVHNAGNDDLLPTVDDLPA